MMARCPSKPMTTMHLRDVPVGATVPLAGLPGYRVMVLAHGLSTTVVLHRPVGSEAGPDRERLLISGATAVRRGKLLAEMVRDGLAPP
jgi:hypothetical protein